MTSHTQTTIAGTCCAVLVFTAVNAMYAGAVLVLIDLIKATREAVFIFIGVPALATVATIFLLWPLWVHRRNHGLWVRGVIIGVIAILVAGIALFCALAFSIVSSGIPNPTVSRVSVVLAILALRFCHL